MKLASRYKIGPLFTPPVESKWGGPLATLMLPSAGGGANWPGGSFDPETKTLYVYSTTVVTPLGLVPSDGSRSDMAYIRGEARDPRAPSNAAAAAAGAVVAPYRPCRDCRSSSLPTGESRRSISTQAT